MTQIRIRAVGDHLLPLVDASGATLRGRFAGRDKTGAPLPDGELVAETSYYVRAVARGDVERVEEPMVRVEGKAPSAPIPPLETVVLEPPAGGFSAEQRAKIEAYAASLISPTASDESAEGVIS